MRPLIGAIAYVVAVLVPDCFGSPQGQQTQRRIATTLNPEKRYRELSDSVEIADTIANRAALAEECLALEKFEEAKRHFEVILARPMGDEPLYMVGKARAQFGLGSGGRHGRDPRRSARALAGATSRATRICSTPARSKRPAATEEALAEYRALSDYFVGAEARVRYGMLLARMGREGEAKAWLGRGPDPAAPRRPRMCARRRPNGSRWPKRSSGLELRLPADLAGMSWGQRR